MSNIYQYVGSNPGVANGILRQFNYQPQGRNLADNLRMLVAQHGEPALKAIVDNHPDKDVILEMNNGYNNSASLNASGNESCNCHGCQSKREYFNADGFFYRQEPNATTVQNNFSLIFLAGVTILAIAIMSK